MRGSIAKRLRRITKHDPSTPPTYVYHTRQKAAQVPVSVNPSGFILIDRITRLLVGTSSRAKYQRAKTLYHTFKHTFAKNVFQVGI